MKHTPFCKNKSSHTKYLNEDGDIDARLIKRDPMYNRLFFAAKAKRLGLIDSVKDGLKLSLDDTILYRHLMRDTEEEIIDMMTIGVYKAMNPTPSHKEGESNGRFPPE